MVVAGEYARCVLCRSHPVRYCPKRTRLQCVAGACSKSWLLIRPGGSRLVSVVEGMVLPMDTVSPSAVHCHTQQEKSTLFSGAYGKSRLQTVLARHPAVAELRPTAAKLYWLLWSCAGPVETRPDGQMVLKLRRRFTWHPNKDGELVPGLAESMGFQGKSASVVKRLSVWLSKLKQAGLIEVKRTGRSPIVYILVPPMVPGVAVERVRNSEVRLPQDSEVRLPRKSEVRLPQNSEVHSSESSVRVFTQSLKKNPPPPSPFQASAQVVRMQAAARTAEGGGMPAGSIGQQAAEPSRADDIESMLQLIQEQGGCLGVGPSDLRKGRWTIDEVELVIAAANGSFKTLYDDIVNRDDEYVESLIEAEQERQEYLREKAEQKAAQERAKAEAEAEQKTIREKTIRVKAAEDGQVVDAFIALLRDQNRNQQAVAEQVNWWSHSTANELADALESKLKHNRELWRNDPAARDGLAAGVAELAGWSRKSIAAIEAEQVTTVAAGEAEQVGEIPF
jgi:parvulin-like peptidyl-prolyl isomerase